MQTFVKDLNDLYKKTPALYEKAFGSDGFEWINYTDNESSVITFIRKGHDEVNDIIVVCNFSFINHDNYRIGLPRKGFLKQIMNSDFKKYYGGGMSNTKEIKIEEKQWDNRDYSAEILLPPLGIVIFKIK